MIITMTPVESSNIKAAGYHPATSTMRVQFNAGATWDYTGVPMSLFDEFMASHSKGRFFAIGIKGLYPETHVDPDADEIEVEVVEPPSPVSADKWSLADREKMAAAMFAFECGADQPWESAKEFMPVIAKRYLDLADAAASALPRSP